MRIRKGILRVATQIDLLKEKILDVYSAFERVCQEKNLTFFLTAGTAIGAVRHQGFIPWDDDFDVMMPREDYEKFLQIADKDLPANLRLVTMRNCKGFTAVYAKIQESRESVLEKVEKSLKRSLPHGIYIDIFPIDGYPKSIVGHIMWQMRRIIIGVIESYKFSSFSGHTLLGKIAYIVGAFLSLFHKKLKSKRDILFAYENLCMSFPIVKDGKCAGIWEPSLIHGKRILNVADISDKVIMNFEGRNVPLPIGYDNILTRYYGDYMKLPPEEQREPSHSILDPVPWRLGPVPFDK